MNTTRRITTMLLSLLVTSLVTLLGLSVAAPAQAADYYRYWTYFHVDGSEYVTYTDEGVGSSQPADGSIEAYRYAASADFTKPNLPRIDLGEVSFDDLCADATAGADQKRVGVLLDYGVDADADGQAVPAAEGKCAVVAKDATGLQVLQAVAQVRTQDMGGPFVCAVNGYPAQGCSEQVTTATPADDGFVDLALAADGADSTAENEGTSTLIYAVLGVLVIALIGGGVFLARRRNKS